MRTRFHLTTGLFTVANAILVLMLCGMVVDLREQVQGLKDVLVTKDDIINVSTPRMPKFHEERCTTCHSERRFTGPHDRGVGEVRQALAHMAELPDTNLTNEDMARIHGSLAIMRCASCHGEETMKKLAIKTPGERMEIIREMIEKPGSELSTAEAEDINRSFGELYGF